MANRRILSFKYASQGIFNALKEEPNMKFHFLAAIVVILLGIYFRINTVSWLAVILAIGLVLTLELTNTAIEEIVDSFTSEVHPGAKKAKDVASGAVLVGAVTAVVVGLIVFLPYIFH
jgi:undecaprenol kinase